MSQPALLTRRIGYRLLLAPALLALILISSVQGQTTAFTYQGKLNDNGNPANGQYDFQFKLFDTQTVGTGTQLGSAVTLTNVSVNAGIFTVQLDFGAAVFPGANRFLEIAVKPTSGSTFTLLSPRQSVTSTPYTVRSATAATADTATNATQLGGLPPSGFIQNTTAQQAASNFNIGGTGTASILNATTQFNLGGNRVLSISGGVGDPNSNLFAGVGVGANTTTGVANSFFGIAAGRLNTVGNLNDFFGRSAGEQNTSGSINAFFGSYAGYQNTTGSQNAFFGNAAGFTNTTGNGNSFFGRSSGQTNSTGSFNSIFGYEAGIQSFSGSNNAFFGTHAGQYNDSGSSNSFFGENSGVSNTVGNFNTFIGNAANFNDINATGNNNTLLGAQSVVNSGLSNATAIGYRAQVTQSNSLVLGGITGVNSGTSINVGIGTTAPVARLQVHTTALDQHLYLSSEAPSLALGNHPVRSSATRNGLFALSTADTYFGVEAGGLMIATYGDGRGNIYLNSNYSGTGDPRHVILQPFTGSVAIGTSTPNTFYKLQVEGSTLFRTNNSVDDALKASTTNGNAVYGLSVNGVGIYGESSGSYAGFFQGRVAAAGIVSLFSLGSVGTAHLCLNASQEIATCSSSLRYKTAIQPFTGGLDLIKRLRPINFTWKQGGMRDVGFGAEDVEKVEPLLVTYNQKGEVEGVKYDRLSVVFVNAIKEQQAQIEQQQRQLKERERQAARQQQQIEQDHQQMVSQQAQLTAQQSEIVALRQLLCSHYSNATVCQRARQKTMRH